jgi:hypothetical protein
MIIEAVGLILVFYWRLIDEQLKRPPYMMSQKVYARLPSVIAPFQAPDIVV